MLVHPWCCVVRERPSVIETVQSHIGGALELLLMLLLRLLLLGLVTLLLDGELDVDRGQVVAVVAGRRLLV